MSKHSAMNELTIRTAVRQDMDIFLDWAAKEGWNPGRHDASAFYAADPKGFLLGEIDGRPVAMVSVVAYDQRFGFLGFYIVAEAYRGRGFGRQIWERGIEQLGAHNIGLDGVVAQQPNYRRSGFRYAYGNQRCRGIGRGHTDAAVIALQDVDLEDIARYDRQCFPADRRAFLMHWLKQPESTALGIREANQLKAYGMIRRCREGHKIGPLFADDADLAERLFQTLASQVPGETLYLDIPLVNPLAVDLAKRHELEPVFETARMYTGDDPDIALSKVFGVTSFELG